jgi:hypothetical protein
MKFGLVRVTSSNGVLLLAEWSGCWDHLVGMTHQMGFVSNQINAGVYSDGVI